MTLAQGRALLIAFFVSVFVIVGSGVLIAVLFSPRTAECQTAVCGGVCINSAGCWGTCKCLKTMFQGTGTCVSLD